MYIKALFTFSTLLLTASCGINYSTQPTMMAGFATAQTDHDAPYQFRATDVLVLRQVDDTIAAERMTFELAATPGVGQVELTYNGETYLLNRNDEDPRLNYRDLETEIIMFPVAGSDTETLDYVHINKSGEIVSGYSVFGYDTDPVIVAAFAGTAYYSGDAVITMRSGTGHGFGRGTSSFTVDFDNSTIAGGAVLLDSVQNSNNITFPETEIVFQETEINENGFSGQSEVIRGAADDAYTGGVYLGRFYNGQGSTIAGEFEGSYQDPDSDFSFLYEGGFFAKNTADE